MRFLLIVCIAGLLTSPTRAEMRGSTERIARYMALASAHPKDPAPLVELGANYALRYTDTHDRKDKKDADAWFDRALALDRQLVAPAAWRGLMRCSEARKKLSFAPVREGLRLIDDALAKDPGNLDLRVLRGSLDLELPSEMKRADEASKDFEAVLSAPPAAQAQYNIDLSEVHLKLGKSYRAAGDLAHAKTEWSAAVKANALTPEGQEAQRLLTKYR